MTQTLRVLLVEDQADLRELMADVFTGLGMEVDAVADAGTALELLRAGRPFDVLFSDVYMPGQMSGAELGMRVCKQFPNVRIILASGHARHQLPELPANVDFVQKPYSLSQVIRMLQGTASTSAASS